MFFSKLLVIAYREYVAMVGTKAFIFSLVMIPILMFGSIVLMPTLQKIGGGRTLKIIVADGTGRLMDTIIASADQRNESIKRSKMQVESVEDSHPFITAQDFWFFEPSDAPELDDGQRLEINRRIKQGEIYALVEIPKDLFDKPSKDASSKGGALPKLYAFDSLMSEVRRWLSDLISRKVREERIEQFGLGDVDPQVLAWVDSPVEVLPNRPVDGENPKASQSTSDALKAMFLPFGVMMLMFMVILMAAQPMLESAMEEKTLRISEVLIGSVTPTQLMGGKLLGNVAGSMVIFLLYGCGGIFVLSQQRMLGDLPASLIPWFILFQILGVLFFSSIFLVVGASVNELKEAQSLLLPVWMFLMAPVMVWFIAVRDPNGLVATALSFFPPSCPMTMVLRLASGTAVPWWQPFVAAAMMMVATSAMVVLAGRIYRVGLLKTDGVRSILQLVRRAGQSI